MTLHCLYALPGSDAAGRCLAALAPGDALLLLSAATRLACPAHPELSRWLDSGAALHALDEDLGAHGIDAAAAGVTVIDYAGWVALSLRLQRQQNWA